LHASSLHARLHVAHEAPHVLPQASQVAVHFGLHTSSRVNQQGSGTHDCSRRNLHERPLNRPDDVSVGSPSVGCQAQSLASSATTSASVHDARGGGAGGAGGAALAGGVEIAATEASRDRAARVGAIDAEGSAAIGRVVTGGVSEVRVHANGTSDSAMHADVKMGRSDMGLFVFARRDARPAPS